MGSSINWHKQSQVLTEYAKRKGFKVISQKTDGTSWVDFVNDEIVIHNGTTEEVQFYHLMHELGHVLQLSNSKRYDRQFNKIFKRFTRNSMTYKVKIIEEEIDAWNIGLKLCRRMGLKTDRRKYEIIRAREIATYLRWAV